jgi:hypothetical protein
MVAKMTNAYEKIKENGMNQRGTKPNKVSKGALIAT